MITLFQKVYDPIDIIEMSDDVYPAFVPEYNAAILAIPTDESGLYMGKFKMTIEWLDG